MAASGGAVTLGGAGECGLSDAPALCGGDANCARATSTAVKRVAMVRSIKVSIAVSTSTFKSTNVSRMVSAIPLRRCVTVCAVVTVWSLRVVRVDAIAVVLEPTLRAHLHTARQVWEPVIQLIEQNLHPVNPLAVFSQVGILHIITLHHFHEH